MLFRMASCIKLIRFRKKCALDTLTFSLSRRLQKVAMLVHSLRHECCRKIILMRLDVWWWVCLLLQDSKGWAQIMPMIIALVFVLIWGFSYSCGTTPFRFPYPWFVLWMPHRSRELFAAKDLVRGIKQAPSALNHQWYCTVTRLWETLTREVPQWIAVKFVEMDWPDLVLCWIWLWAVIFLVIDVVKCHAAS